MNVIKPYAPLFTSRNMSFILSGGRDSGKSKAIAQVIVWYMLSHPNRDVIVARDTQASISSSSYAEIEKALSDEGYADRFEFKKSPQKIIRRGNHGTIHFVGIGGADLSRTRSYQTPHSVGIIVLEELQQVRTQASMEQAMASFRRLLVPDDWRVLYVYNPAPQKAHWLNVWTLLHECEPGYCRIHTTYLDVGGYLTNFDLSEIRLKQKTDPDGFKNMYLGIPCGGLGSIYPMFKRETMMIDAACAQNWLFENGRNPIAGLIVGGDGAVNRDATAFVPLAIFADGRALVLDIFYHTPDENGVMGSSQLMPYLRRWFDDICAKYNLKDPSAPTPIVFSIDCAAADLLREVAYEFGNEAIVRSCPKQTIPQMVSVVQSVLSNNAVYLLKTNEIFNYFRKRPYSKKDILAEQLESLVWKTSPNGVANLTYDPLVPNDVSDAFTYAILAYYRNPDNLPWAVTNKEINYFEPLKA